jgi:hypothetical protein
MIVNLWRNPANILEGLAVVNALTKAEAPDLETGQGALEIYLGKEKFGEAMSCAWKDFQPDWMLPATFAQSDLIRMSHFLLKGYLWLPGYGIKGQIPLCPLEALATLGPDGRDIHDGFDVTDKTTLYPALWGHKSEETRTIGLEPNKFLAPLSAAKKGRPLRKITDLWPKSSRLLIGARVWIHTNSSISVYISQPVLSNVWWPIALHGELSTPHHEKILALWFNSTLGFLSILVNRQETRGAWIQFKKPVLGALPVLDIRALSNEQKEKLVAAYDKVCQLELKPFPQMATDTVRAEIDRAIAEALGLPDFGVLRTLLGREPVVCLQRI